MGRLKNIQPLIEDILPEITELRHDLHRHPELGYEEERTAAQVSIAALGPVTASVS